MEMIRMWCRSGWPWRMLRGSAYMLQLLMSSNSGNNPLTANLTGIQRVSSVGSEKEPNKHRVGPFEGRELRL
ncbi:hypothetical protein EDD16DRAFT_1660800 [Pisolithus croceorrhizus]|nr:hypothetical protein EDD16DRAFT_1660800 [Pisolithus croceorrhizus]KAI6125321.1 hypothetical protein EV401DRAFT_1939376 [Pisolithus croceorrhizus]KAI6137632.1 hypothetical protein EDD17DRAFT_1677297 [Pisolithus thermaeus]